MSKIVLDTQTQILLNGLKAPVEVCDASGQTLGHFLPQKLYQELMRQFVRSQFTDEQVEQARQQTGGRPLAEIWKDLGRK